MNEPALANVPVQNAAAQSAALAAEVGPGDLGGLLPRLAGDPALLSLLGRSHAVVAVPSAARALALAGLSEASGRRPILVVAATRIEAEQLASDLGTILGPDEVELFGEWETLPFERVSPAVATMGQRSRVLCRLEDPARAPALVVASARALVQRLDPEAATAPIVVGSGDAVDFDELLERLARFGYRRQHQVEHRGEMALRGSILDVYPSTFDAPVRIDFWGDEIDRLSEFSVGDQRSTVPLAEVEIHPCRELRPGAALRKRAMDLVVTESWGAEQWQRLADGELFDGMESWLPWLVESEVVLPDLIGAGAAIVVIEPALVRRRVLEIIAEEQDLAATLARTWRVGDGAMHRLHVEFDRLLAGAVAPVWTILDTADSPDTAALAAHGWDTVNSTLEPRVNRLRDLIADGYSIVLCCDLPASARRLTELMASNGLVFSPAAKPADLTRPGGHVVVAPLSRGALLPGSKLAVLAESDITGRRRTHRRPRSRRDAQTRYFDDLAVGAYVVHKQHGIARFGGMVKRSIGGHERDYLLLEYRGHDRLFLPSEQVDAIRPYSASDSPSLSRMGGSEWSAAKARVRSAAQKIAEELVLLYQRRSVTPGHGFAPDTPWQRELEDGFAFQETRDQLAAIADVKQDMERPVPMDRLVVGDVGFGKTEIALRAAFKAIQEGRQVGVLVPTTLLAQQHHQTFQERFAPYPIRVEMLSRFLTPVQARSVSHGLRSGDVDLVIGTHRLLSSDVKFKQLGLLVVDEEQRFGVRHKEAIKALRSDVDVLTLTATPIPRTLELSLTGIRDMSLLDTPPADRRPILTYVGTHSERVVAEAIRRELLREGQIFYVHNRVMDIEHVAERLRNLVPEARIVVAHGQLDEGTLERAVLDFWDHRYDLLVCTTIIESGIDMPTVNTLVVDQAHLLGLGQLHQLRGRVGRAGQRAYAYLFYPVDHVLDPQAHERLRTVGEATELGSGFRIAMRDLEIRGAGNLLGDSQSGHIAAVGYDLYCQMVTEAVAQLSGEVVPSPAEVSIDVPAGAHLPADYVTVETARLEAYRRLAVAGSSADVDDIRDEWIDRFGQVPEPAQALLDVARLRAECRRRGITDVLVSKGSGFGGPEWVARISPVRLPESRQVRLQRLYGSPDRGSGRRRAAARSSGGLGPGAPGRSAIYKEATGEIQVSLRSRDGQIVTQIIELVSDLVEPPEAAAAESGGPGSAGGEPVEVAGGAGAVRVPAS